MEPVEKNKAINVPNPYSEPYSDNQAASYQQKTGDTPYKNHRLAWAATQRQTVHGVSDQVRHKSAFTVTEAG